MKNPPATITYARTVSRETVIIALTLAALKYFPVKLADIQNAYIVVPVTENIWKVLGREFDEYYDRKAILVWSLYFLNSSGSAFRNHLADYMHHLELLPCPADPDLWMKPMVRPEYGFNYYTYVLTYVYYVMVIYQDAEIVLRRIDKYFKLNPSFIGDLNI